MSRAVLKKGFNVDIPFDIRKRVSFREGDQLIVKLAGRDAIILQKPPKEKSKEEVIDETFGAWKDEFDDNMKSPEIVNKLRKAWRRKVG
jgi:bifunctional DNA-binding transcriptional regulator/antitoxin component of YhaV-PrlF toxin-antitoxin module